MTSSKKVIFGFFKTAENLWFRLFCTHKKQWYITQQSTI